VNQGRLERHRCRYDVWVSSLAGSLRLSSGGMCVQVRQTPQGSAVGRGTPSILGIAQPSDGPCLHARQWNRL
jgi:hypothetical protein